MSTYSFKITKGQYQLNLITTDKELLSEQFEKWVQSSSGYVQRKKIQAHKDTVDTQIKAEEEITRKNIEEQISRNSSPEVVEPENVVESVPEVSNEDNQEVEKENSESDLDIFYAPPQPETIAEKEAQMDSAGVFDNILENSMNNPQTELSFKPNPSIKKDNAFLNYIGNRNIEKRIDYLLLTAYYFAQYEQRPRFTLKQLNSKLMQNLAVIVDHSVLQEAINRDYIECLPDLTGLVGASEYRLTAYGEKTLLDE